MRFCWQQSCVIWYCLFYQLYMMVVTCRGDSGDSARSDSARKPFDR